MPDQNTPYVPQQGFDNMLRTVGQKSTQTKKPTVQATSIPDLSGFKAEKPFTADPKDPSHWRLDPVTNKPVALKGPGFLGSLKVPGTTDLATEYSVGVNINGKQIDIPSLVPTLTTEEVQQTLEAASKDAQPPQSVIDKATAHAQERIKAGKSPFAGPEDAPNQGGATTQ